MQIFVSVPLISLIDRHPLNISDSRFVSSFGWGSNTLAWEQFTTFWVEAATINTHTEVSTWVGLWVELVSQGSRERYR